MRRRRSRSARRGIGHDRPTGGSGLHGRARRSDRRGVSAPLILAAVALAAAIALLLFLRSGGGDRDTATEEDEPSGLVATVTECRQSGDTLWTVGTLRNAASIPIRNIELSLTWTDADGEEVASEIIELVGAEGLMVDQTTSFRGFTLAENASDCDAGVFFYEPIT